VKDTGEVVSEAAEKVVSEAAVSMEVLAEASVEATDLTIITTITEMAVSVGKASEVVSETEEVSVEKVSEEDSEVVSETAEASKADNNIL
jgi:hypothetical protein